MTEKELEIRRNHLVEQLGVQMEKDHQYAPVAARILATLALTCKRGITFEELVCDLKASKSTVSTHLAMLETKSHISYFTKPGDRKRYYKISSHRLIHFIDERLNKWENDIALQKELISFKKTVNEFYKDNDECHCDLSFNESFLNFLEEAKQAFKRLKNNLEKDNHKPQ